MRYYGILFFPIWHYFLMFFYWEYPDFPVLISVFTGLIACQIRPNVSYQARSVWEK